MLIFSKGHNSRKGDNSDKKTIQVSYFSMRNQYMKFQNPSIHVHEIWHESDFVRIFSKGHNSREGDNSDKNKKRMSTIFP